MPSSPVEVSDLSSHRNRSLRLAVITSLMSKVGTIVLRLVSIPIAVHLLGMEMFGVYTAITMTVGLIDLLHIGIGPALTKALAQAIARGDREQERTVFGTSILLSIGLTCVAAILATLILLNVPIPDLFGDRFEPVKDEMFRAALLGLIIIQVEMLCIPFDMARDGYQETRFTNTWGAAGNVFGALTLLAGIWFFPTIEFLLIAVNGSIALAKLGNTCHLLWQRPYLFPRLSLFRKSLIPDLAKDGARFSVTYILAAATEYNLMAFLIGHHVGPAAVGVYNVMITVHFSLTGLVCMVTKPYWPALMDACERQDYGWISKSCRRLRLGGVGFALLAGIGLVAVGPWLLPFWAGDEFYTAVGESFRMDRVALLAFAAYFLLHIWRHVNQTLALGVGAISPVTKVVMLEAVVLVAGAGYALYTESGIATIYFVMAGAIAACSGWLFPRFFRNAADAAKRTDMKDVEAHAAPRSFKRTPETRREPELQSEVSLP